MISPDINAQTKKQLKKIKKLELKFSLRDMDLNKKFVVFVEIPGYLNQHQERIESVWKSKLFENGLNVGDYYYKKKVKDSENREFLLENKMMVRGTYFITIKGNKSIIITNINDNNSIVGTITAKPVKSKTRSMKEGCFGEDYFVDHIIKELVKRVKSL